MYSRKNLPISKRTVGVLYRDDCKTQLGYNLLVVGREQYLLDSDGRVVHEWHSKRLSFAAYLLPNGNLLRDGSEKVVAPLFLEGGAAGYIECVTWENELVWSFARSPYTEYLTHHDIEPLPNGNVLILTWQRKSKEQAIAAGRRPELIPNGEVWNQLVEEIKPDGKGGASVVWKWSLWDHLIQDFDESKANFGIVKDHHELFDINFCPPGGKAASRNRTLLDPKLGTSSATFPSYSKKKALTGERDFVHCNSVSYDLKRDQIILSMNIPCEVIIIDHSTTTEEASGHIAGLYKKGGDILWRYGNPQTYRHGSHLDQTLFMQHSVQFLRGVPGEGHVLLFNNGRHPDRHWSSAEEFKLPEITEGNGVYLKEEGTPFGPSGPIWTFGPSAGRRNSFYCTHISAVQRMQNGNTLITLGPQGTIIEVTPNGDEVWRYVSPVVIMDTALALVRQGDQRVAGRFSLFRMLRYTPDYAAFKNRNMTPNHYLEPCPIPTAKSIRTRTKMSPITESSCVEYEGQKKKKNGY